MKTFKVTVKTNKGEIINVTEDRKAKYAANKVVADLVLSGHEIEMVEVEEVKKKTKLSKFIKVTGGILAVAVVVGACTSNAEPVKETAAPKVEQKQEQKKEANKITQANFDLIVEGNIATGDGGMSKDEVIALLGKEKNSTQSKSGQFEIESLGWADYKTGTIISVTFTNGKVSNKTIMKA